MMTTNHFVGVAYAVDAVNHGRDKNQHTYKKQTTKLPTFHIFVVHSFPIVTHSTKSQNTTTDY